MQRHYRKPLCIESIRFKDVDMKKFIVIKFLDFKMIDSRTMISKFQEF